ncbi:hypothetical protein BJY04DRAFT_203739 [Aspergillus karnatakaensis]|uniref:uncharacterized protein n=1 Tax=Aspergillus karnatakaensis TaxID=1810916 RepID=UPI003CCDF7D1
MIRQLHATSSCNSIPLLRLRSGSKLRVPSHYYRLICLDLGLSMNIMASRSIDAPTNNSKRKSGSMDVAGTPLSQIHRYLPSANRAMSMISRWWGVLELVLVLLTVLFWSGMQGCALVSCHSSQLVCHTTAFSNPWGSPR